jgi:alkylated DNA repair dioxygenase AlkB
LKSPDEIFDYMKRLEWEDRTSARRELFFATVTDPYTYGTGEFARTYVPKPMNEVVGMIGNAIAERFGFKNYELCFLNYYESERQALGWHADDAESIDHTRPIAVVSVGAERQIWTKPMGGTADDVEKILLHNGSLLLMNAGMQHTHWHRIPKHDRPCGPRISLTYRGFKS